MMKKLTKTAAIILVMAMAMSSVSAVLAEETAAQPAVQDAPVVSEPAPEPVVVEAPKPAPAEEKPAAPEATAAPEVTEAPEATAEPEPTAAPEESVSPEESVAPEETAEPEVAEATEAPVEEIVAEPLPTEEPAVDLSNVTITIDCLNGSSAKLGETVTLVAHISGLDGVAYAMQWQYQSAGEWHDISGANDSTYHYTLTEKNADYAWRIALTVD